MSMRVIDYMVDRNHIDVDDEVIKKAKDLAFDKSKPIAEKKFLYDIVANSRDSTDACTIDSVMRDMRFCGLHRSFDFSRGFDIRVIDDKICYFYDHYTRIHDFFLARADLHRLVYTHSDIKVIELMVADALVKAKATLNFTFENPADYLKWDDTVLDTIENSTDQSLKESQDLIRRVRDKDFYKLCSEVVVPEDKLNLFKEVTPEDVFSCVQKTSGGVPLPLGEENIRVSNVAFGKKNPFESIYFHNKKLFKSQITLIPDDYASFQGKIVRVFAVSNQSEHTKAISEGFGTFVYNKYGLRPMNLEGNLTASFGDCYPCLKRLLVLMSVLSENREPAAEKYVAQLLEETKKCPELATFRGRSFQKVESIEDLKCVKFLKTKGWYHVEMECYVESWHPMLNEMQLYAKTNKITLKLIKIAEWTELDHVKINNVEKDEMAGRTCRLLEYHTD